MYEVKDNPQDPCPSPMICWRVLTRPFRMFHPVVWLVCGFLISSMMLSGGPQSLDLPQMAMPKSLQSLTKRLSRYEHEVRLIEHLKEKARAHGPEIHPGEAGSDPVKVYFGVSLLFVEDLVNYRFGYGDVTLRCVDRYLWQDDRLAWDPSAFGGTTSVRMPIKNIWSPDIRLLNSLDVSIDEDRDGILAVIYNTGKVLFIPPARHRVRCTRNQDLKKRDRAMMEPYDWLCTMKFASWTHDQKALDPDFYPGQKTVDMTDFQQKHGRLKVLNSYVEKKVDRQFKDPYPDLQFHIMFKEKPEGTKKAPARRKIPVGKGSGMVLPGNKPGKSPGKQNGKAGGKAGGKSGGKPGGKGKKGAGKKKQQKKKSLL